MIKDLHNLGRLEILKRTVALKLILFCIVNIMSIGILFIMSVIYTDKALNIEICIVAVLQSTAGLYVLKEFYSLFSLAPIFLVLTELFHFGEAFVLALGRNDLINHSNVELAGSIKTYNLANIFALLVQAFLVVGCSMFSHKFDGSSRRRIITNASKVIESSFHNSKDYTYSIGLIAMIIGAIPTVIYNFSMIRLALSGTSYNGIRSAVDLGPLMLLTCFFRVGVVSMILGKIKSNSKRKAKIILLIASAFEVLCMLSGNRGKQLCILIVYLFIYYRYIEKFKWRNIISACIIGYLGIAFLYLVSSMRLYGMGNALKLENFVRVLSGGPILKLLAEQGSTLNMVALTMRDVPNYTPYVIGQQYLVSLLSIFPDTGGWQGNLPNLVGTLYYLNTDLTLGDSYIAELYHNFGWFGSLFAIFIGAFLGRVTTRIEELINSDNYLLMACYMILFSKLLWMVRCNFFNFLYDFTWATVSLLFISICVKSSGCGRTIENGLKS